MPRWPDGFAVGFERPGRFVVLLVPLLAGVEDDADVDAARRRLAERFQHRGVIELVDRGAQGVALLGLLDVPDQRLFQPAREPGVRGRSDLVGRLVAESADVRLRPRDSAIEVDRSESRQSPIPS